MVQPFKIMLSNQPRTGVFRGSAIQNNAQPNTAEYYLSVCEQLYLFVIHGYNYSLFVHMDYFTA